MYKRATAWSVATRRHGRTLRGQRAHWKATADSMKRLETHVSRIPGAFISEIAPRAPEQLLNEKEQEHAARMEERIAAFTGSPTPERTSKRRWRAVPEV